MIFAMADIHGYADVFQRRIQQIEGYLEKGHQLILLGDYIDRGPASYQSLHLAYSLQKKYGKDRVVVLKGNHEQWFLDFLYEGADEWLAEDENNRTTATFLSEEELAEIRGMAYRESLYSLKDKIKKRNKPNENSTKIKN